MISYWNIQYYFKEQNLAAQKPKNAKKIFNLCYLSLWNIVELIFEINKRCFKIINTPSKYSLKTQINLIFILTSLYNFIKDHLLQNIDYFKVENNNPIIQSGKSDNLLLDNSLVIFT